MRETPLVYHQKVLGEDAATDISVEDDLYSLAILKHYRSLMPLAQAKRKPIFKLTAGDGAIGAHYTAVQQVGKEFRSLARRIEHRITQ